VLKFLPSLVKKIFFPHLDHDEEKDITHSIKGEKNIGDQVEASICSQVKVSCLAKDKG
jgi:hypothetical protein